MTLGNLPVKVKSYKNISKDDLVLWKLKDVHLILTKEDFREQDQYEIFEYLNRCGFFKTKDIRTTIYYVAQFTYYFVEDLHEGFYLFKKDKIYGLSTPFGVALPFVKSNKPRKKVYEYGPRFTDDPGPR